MFPVLADQEIQAIEMRRRHLLADAERGRLARISDPVARETTAMTPLPTRVRSWLRIAVGWTAGSRTRSAPAIGEGIGGASV